MGIVSEGAKALEKAGLGKGGVAIEPLAASAGYRALDVMSDAEILTIIPMEGNFSKDEREAFCAGVRRCAQYLLSRRGLLDAGA